MPAGEHDEHAQALVPREAVVGARRDERRLPFAQPDGLALDRQLAFAFEDDVQLVVGVSALAVRLRRDEDVHADLEAGRLVDDLVAAAGRHEPPPRRFHLDRVHGGP